MPPLAFVHQRVVATEDVLGTPEQAPGKGVRVFAFLLDQGRHHFFRVTGHDPESVVQYGPGRIHVDGGLSVRACDLGTRVERLGQTQSL